MGKGKGKRSGKGRGKVGNSVDGMLVNAARASGSGNTEILAMDLRVRRQNMNLVQTPPKNFMSDIYWVRASIAQDNAYVTNTSTNNEVGFTFTLSAVDNGSTYAAVFDQYCIYGVTVDLSFGSNNTANGNIDCHTAIDYDNVAAIGLPAMTAFNSYNHAVLNASGSNVVRFVKPCIATSAYNGAFTGFTTTRSWIDANSPSVLHYGLRVILGSSGAALSVTATFSYVIGFRNAHG